MAGTVVGCFRTGFYVLAGRALFAVVAGAGPRGPLNVMVPSPAPPATPGSRVHLSLEQITTSCGVIDLRDAVRWRPDPLVEPSAQVAAGVLGTLPAAAQPPSDLAAVWAYVRRGAVAGDLHAVRAALQGRGVGLTPTGDDVLAGLLLMVSLHERAPIDTLDVASSAETTDLSRQFLWWAAQGQSIEPVHDLLHAAAADDRPRAETAARVIASIGHSSGPAILAGLRLGSGWLAQSTTRFAHDEDGSLS